jgi:hypothetical protein
VNARDGRRRERRSDSLFALSYRLISSSESVLLYMRFSTSYDSHDGTVSLRIWHRRLWSIRKGRWRHGVSQILDAFVAMANTGNQVTEDGVGQH